MKERGFVATGEVSDGYEPSGIAAATALLTERCRGDCSCCVWWRFRWWKRAELT